MLVGPASYQDRRQADDSRVFAFDFNGALADESSKEHCKLASQLQQKARKCRSSKCSKAALPTDDNGPDSLS